MAGRCAARPDLAGTALPLLIRIPALPSRGGPDLVDRFFAPLGWTVVADPVPLDPHVPEWGDSRYVDATLTATMPLDQALTQLYVLLPVLDDAKHYWVTQDEVDKLIRAAGSWLPDHPERDLITRRYVAHQRSLVLSAVERLAEIDVQATESVEDPAPPETAPAQHSDVAPAPALADQRRSAVLAQLHAAGATRVVDLGCGEGALVRMLLQDPAFTQVLGVDVSPRALELAQRRLQLDRMPDSQRARLTLLQSSLTYRDDRLAGFDAAVLMEVVEHLDPDRLPSLELSVFGHARPRTVLVTTPNAEFNARYERLRSGGFRNPDHRFEWTRAEFSGWAQAVAVRHGYSVRHVAVGEIDPELGPPTQLAVFTRTDPADPTTAEESP
jgi:3' terminal RNA ribose 2'-O-methyltransferase Hen1